ncbi:MAG: pyruvate kinase [Cytophagales bacterium]|nr:MAG: pyruvate kinase [Cytophagales bacterium]
MKDVFVKTKIIATVGPACNTKEKLAELVREGTDAFRLNFSHGAHEEHLQVIKYVKELNEENDWNICILQDLSGPKIRTREVENNAIELVAGKKIIITTEKIVGTATRISTTYEAIAKDVRQGDRILLDDGKIELKALRTLNENELEAEIIYGGILSSKKGMNLPDTIVSSPSLTEKDNDDLLFGLEHDVDWVALSFVRNAIDILLLKHIIRQKNKPTKVIAKIEKPEAITNIDEIIQAADALMVARGDLGVEISIEEVPLAQKMIVQKCRKASKPVIIATQMLESMITSPRPTRAETNDIANAVIDGADAVMLSGETAVGKYPLLVLKTMNDTIRNVEQKVKTIYHQNFDIDPQSDSFYHDSVVGAACILAKDTNAKAIIGMTNSGYTAFQIASHRPEAHIFIFTSNKVILNMLSLVSGVRAFFYNKFVSTDDTFQDVQNILIKKKLLKKDDVCIQLASMPIAKKMRTNVIKLSVVGRE